MFSKLRNRFKESNRRTWFKYTTNVYNNTFGMNSMLSVSLFIFAVISFFSINYTCVAPDNCNSMVFTGNMLEAVLTIFPLLVIFSYLVIGMVDGVIEYYSKQITDNDIAISKFIGRKLFGEDHEGCGDGYSYFIFLSVSVGIVWGIWFTVMWPTLVWVWILFGGHYALVKLANLVYRTSKRLRNHVNDPDAHSKKG